MTAVQVEIRSVPPTERMEVTREEQCFCLHKLSADAYAMLHETYGEYVLPYNTARRGFNIFNDERESTSKEDGDPHCEKRSSNNVKNTIKNTWT